MFYYYYYFRGIGPTILLSSIMTIKVMVWNPPNAFNLGHMAIQTEDYYASIWPAGDYIQMKSWRALENPVAASLVIHMERDVELEGCEPDEVFEITENALDPYVNQAIKLFLLQNDIDPNWIKLHRVQARIQELESFIELIRSSSDELDDDRTYANYVEFRKGYKTNRDEDDLHDEMNCVIERIRGSRDVNLSEIRKRFFPSEVPILKQTQYTVFVMSESFPRIIWEDLRRSRYASEYSIRLLSCFNNKGPFEPKDVGTMDISIPPSMNCVTFVLFLLIVADRTNEYPFWLIFSERGLFGFLNHIPSWASRFVGNNNRFFVIPLLQFILIFLPLMNAHPSCVDYRFYSFQNVVLRNRKCLVIMLVLLVLATLVMTLGSISWFTLIFTQLTNSLDFIEAINNFFCNISSFLKGYGLYFVAYIILSLSTFTFLMLFSVVANKGPRYSYLSNPPEISKVAVILSSIVALMLPPCIPFIAFVMLLFPSTFLYFFGSVLSGLFMCIRHYHFDVHPDMFASNFYNFQMFRTERGYMFENNGLLNGIRVQEEDDDDE